MVLSDQDIKKSIESKEISITGVKDVYIGPSSVDLHLSGVSKKMKDCPKSFMVDTRLDNSNIFKREEFNEIQIYPGEFYLLSTKEKITINNSIAGFVQGRSSIARVGISVHSAGFVDPGFSGTITLEVTNLTKVPVILYKGQRICQMVFERLENPCEIDYAKKHDSKYQGQIDPEQSKIQDDFKHEN